MVAEATEELFSLHLNLLHNTVSEEHLSHGRLIDPSITNMTKQLSIMSHVQAKIDHTLQMDSFCSHTVVGVFFLVFSPPPSQLLRSKVKIPTTDPSWSLKVQQSADWCCLSCLESCLRSPFPLPTLLCFCFLAQVVHVHTHAASMYSKTN